MPYLNRRAAVSVALKDLHSGRIKLPPGERKLIRMLAGSSPVLVAETLRRLADKCRSQLFPLASRLMQDPKPTIRYHALLAAARWGSPRHIAVTEKQMYDPVPWVRARAVELHGILAQRIPEAQQALERRARRPMDMQTVKAVAWAFSLTPKYGANFELYRGVLTPHFCDPKALIRRVRQPKDGEPTVLLGGGLLGKVRIVKVGAEALAAWKLAFEAGLPVEPILKRKSGALRIIPAKDGQHWVCAQLLPGRSSRAFIAIEGNEVHLPAMKAQIVALRAGLAELGIDHGHPHGANLVAVMEGSQPKLWLIDMGQSRFTDGRHEEFEQQASMIVPPREQASQPLAHSLCQ